MFGPAFTAGLSGIPLRADWPLYATANGENGAVMSASAEEASHPAWHLHKSGGWWSTNASDAVNGAGSWVQVQFDSYRRATHYTLNAFSGASNQYVQFDLLGSTDGVAFTILDSNAVVSSIGGGVAITDKPLAIQTPFLIYRIAVDAAYLNSIGPGNEGPARLQNWLFTFSAS